MARNGQGTRGSGRHRPSAPSSSKKHYGPIGLVGNLVGDVKDAVVGLPMGLKMIATDPKKAGSQMAGAAWQTWSPLFHGHPLAFAKQTYDHPLAPLLDAATVFSLGAGSAARGASLLTKAGVESGRVAKVAALREPRALKLSDPTDQMRLPQERQLSTRAGRRLVQETRIALEPHLPKWYTGTARKVNYERAHAVDMAHRLAAKHLMSETALRAGKALDDPKVAPRARQEILANLWLNLYRHNRDRKMTVEEAGAYLRKNKHYGVLTNPQALNSKALQLDSQYSSRLAKLERRNERLVKAAQAPKSAKKRALAELKLKRTTQEIAELKKRRGEFKDRGFRDYFVTMAKDEKSFERAVENFGRHAVTRNVVRGSLDSEGKVTLVPMHDPKMLGWEAKQSSAFVKWAWRNPTRLWKSLQLGYTPRTVTNNAVGNWFLFAMRDGGHGAVYSALRNVGGKKFELKAHTPYGEKGWMHKYFGNELGNVFGQTLADEGGRMPGKLAQGVYPLVHKTSDTPVRAASIRSYLAKDKKVREYMAQGLSFDRAATRALRQDSGLQKRASDYTRSIAGDYFTIQPWERVVRDLVPFYLWDRHIVKTTGNMVMDTPGRVAILQQISNMGVEETEKILGDIPEFLRGSVPFGKSGGRARVLMTQSLNPFATIGELAGLAEATTTGGGAHPGAAIGSQLNPLVSGSVEFMTGRSLLTGAPKPQHGGLVSSVGANALLGVPGVRMAQSLMEGAETKTGAGNDLLMARGPRREISSNLGFPFRDISLEQASKMAQRESGAEKRKKRRRKGRHSQHT